MEKRIPIDELFRDKLLGGEEQLNLGAWANMERMLDGKNPYAKEDDKKRRIFPFLLIFLFTLGISGAGYFLTHSGKSPKESADARVSTTPQTSSSSSAQASQPEKSISEPVSNDVSHAANPGNLASQPSSLKGNKSRANSPGSVSKENRDPIKSNKKSHKQHLVTSNPAIQSNDVKNNASNTSNALNQSSNTQTNTIVSNKKKSTKIGNTSHVLDSKSSESEFSRNDLNGLQTKAQTSSKIESIPKVTIQQKTVQNRNGNPERLVGDTVEISSYEKLTSVVTPERPLASLDPMITNPRYRLLSKEEEVLNAQRNSDQPQTNESSHAVVASTSSTSEMVLASSSKTKSSKQSGNLEGLKKFASNAFDKVNNILLYRPKPDIYTGLNLGVNASLSNKNHNFGGFQGGFVLLRPINDYVSFISECKFFYRNNGGYTVNDSYYQILNPSKDTSSILHQSIYSYQKDSTVRTYNFKNFYSIELPLMMQVNYRSFAIYGGVNIAYNFKIKTTEKTRNYVVNHSDTLQSATPYTYPIEKPSQYLRSDFSARFGIGYTVGGSYSISPNLYLDLRITQNVWDNMRTNQAREISNGFFKVPGIQIGLGYRFRDFKPDN
jgi:hypothetical protein